MPTKFTSLSTKSFGIEIEVADMDFMALHHRLLRAFRSRQRDYQFNSTRQYFRSTGETFDLKTDSSCGYELATPLMQWNSEEFQMFETLLQTLQELQLDHTGLIDNRCSVHIHHDINHLTYTQLRKLVQLWYVFEPLAFSLVRERRLLSPYCMPMRLHHHMWNTGINGYRQIMNTARRIGRRTALNLTEYPRRRAVEFRIFHGSISADEIFNWTKWTQFMIMLATRRLRLASLNRCLNDSSGNQLEHFGRLLRNFFDAELVQNHIEWLGNQQSAMSTSIPSWMLAVGELSAPTRGINSSVNRVRYLNSMANLSPRSVSAYDDVIFWVPSGSNG